MTTVEPSLSEGRRAATEPGGRGLPGLAAWLPTWDLITTNATFHKTDSAQPMALGCGYVTPPCEC